MFARAWLDLREHLARLGRDAEGFPNGIATMWTYVTDDTSEAEAVLGEVLAPMLNRPIEELRPKLPVGTPSECAERMARYAEAGAQRVFLWPVRDEVRQIERFRREVWPRLEGFGAVD